MTTETVDRCVRRAGRSKPYGRGVPNRDAVVELGSMADRRGGSVWRGILDGVGSRPISPTRAPSDVTAALVTHVRPHGPWSSVADSGAARPTCSST